MRSRPQEGLRVAPPPSTSPSSPPREEAGGAARNGPVGAGVRPARSPRHYPTALSRGDANSLHDAASVSDPLAFFSGRPDFRGKSAVGAEGGTRTPTGCPTRPSNVRVCQFRHFGALRGRSISLSRAADNSPDALAEPRVERIANPLAQEVVGEHREENREAGIDRQPPADLDRVLAFVQDVAPRRVRRLHTESEA